MIDASLIQQHYASMSNEALLHLAHHEGHELSADAVSALYQEFRKRGLDTDVFPGIRQQHYAAKRAAQQAMARAAATEMTNRIWYAVLRAKMNGASNTAIAHQLLNDGIDPEYIEAILDSLEPQALHLKNVYDSEAEVSGILFLIGLLVGIITMLWLKLSWGLVVFAFALSAGAKWMAAGKRAQEMRRVLNQLAAEKEAANASMAAGE